MTEGDHEPSSPVCFLSESWVGLPPSQDWPAVSPWRRAQRERLRAERLALSPEARRVKAEALAHHLDAVLWGSLGDVRGRVLSGYWPIKGELDLRPWLASLHDKGGVIGLPVVEEPGAPLAFRRWSPGMAMVRGHWAIPVPPTQAETVVPELALAPLVGWDAEGLRLGYGGGTFDRTLAALAPKPLALGVGLQSAYLPTILPQPHDIPMSAIVTEAGIQIGSAAAQG